MPPHPSQPGLEVNDSPGLEVVYMSNDAKPRIEDHASGGYYHEEQATGFPGYGYRQTDFHNINPHSQGSPVDYPQSNNYYDGTDKEVLPYGSPNEKTRKMILGLPVWLFWLIIILISAGAIAGGVGGSLAVKNAELKYVMIVISQHLHKGNTNELSVYQVLKKQQQLLPIQHHQQLQQYLLPLQHDQIKPLPPHILLQ